MEGLADFLGEGAFWRRAYNEQSDGIEITETFQQEDSTELETRRIANADIVPWLDQRFAVDKGANKRDGIMRIVWVYVDANVMPWRTDMKESVFESLLEGFELKGAHQLIPLDGGIIFLPADHQNKQSFALQVSALAVSIIWTYNLETNSTEVIWLFSNTFFSSSLVQDILQRQKRLARHPMFIAFLAAVLILDRTTRVFRDINMSIVQTENRTRHSSLHGDTYPVAEGSYASLSARMSGSATVIAAVEWNF